MENISVFIHLLSDGTQVNYVLPIHSYFTQLYLFSFSTTDFIELKSQMLRQRTKGLFKKKVHLVRLLQSHNVNALALISLKFHRIFKKQTNTWVLDFF